MSKVIIVKLNNVLGCFRLHPPLYYSTLTLSVLILKTLSKVKLT